MMDFEQMIEDFAVVTYLKNNTYGKHESQIRAEALERIYKFGAAAVTEKVIEREHQRLKQMVFEFETLHGLSDINKDSHG